MQTLTVPSRFDGAVLMEFFRWLRGFDPETVTRSMLKRIGRFTNSHDYNPEILETRLGKTKAQVPIAVARLVFARFFQRQK